MLKSYYEILNVAPSATKIEIKNQYRKLVRIYHPDINPTAEAERLFKEINKAADILLDDEKRKNYDKFRSKNKVDYLRNSSNYTFSDLFKTKKEKPQQPVSKDGEDIIVSIDIDFSEAFLGTYRVVNIARSMICPKCGGHKFVNGNKCSYCDGLGEKILKRKITVKIPPSVKDKTKLRIKGEGQFGVNGGKNGNLYVVVNIEKNDELKIKDGIVYYTAQISPYCAILGGNITVPTLWGQAVIKIPPLTKANQSFKLIDVGVLNEKTNKKGDEIVKILIQIPSKITDEEIELYKKLNEINKKNSNAKYG